MIETLAPGKLFVLGEYAVIEPGEPAVLIAVDRFLRLRLREQAEASNFDASPHVRAAIDTVEMLRAERGFTQKHFSIEIASELNDESGRKYGLGSSAAVTVATIEALSQLYALGLDETTRLKLALLATIEVSPRASGGDLAASTFGGWIRYTSPDRSALKQFRAAHTLEETLDSPAWQKFSVARLSAPTALRLLVGWTGTPASTEALVSQTGSALPSAGTGGSPRDAVESFLVENRARVRRFVEGLPSDTSALRSAVSDARESLKSFSSIAGVNIETELLRELCDIAQSHGAAAKPSGAGGGDCGIVLADSATDIPGLLEEWNRSGIVHLDLNVHDSNPRRESTHPQHPGGEHE